MRHRPDTTQIQVQCLRVWVQCGKSRPTVYPCQTLLATKLSVGLSAMAVSAAATSSIVMLSVVAFIIDHPWFGLVSSGISMVHTNRIILWTILLTCCLFQNGGAYVLRIWIFGASASRWGTRVSVWQCRILYIYHVVCTNSSCVCANPLVSW